MNTHTRRHEILLELHAARSDFHRLVDSLPRGGFQRQSHNPGWTNGEILAHVAFGFIIINVLLPLARLWGRLPRGSSRWFAGLLNAGTRPFNWFNALGTRGQARVFTQSRLRRIFDRAYFALSHKVQSIPESEWERGMYYPTKWDANFDEFMTLEKLFHYPVVHFHFHQTQIVRDD